MLGFLIILWIGCSSSAPLKTHTNGAKTVSVAASDLIIKSDNKWFSMNTERKVETSKLVENQGREILTSIKRGYPNQIKNYTIVDEETISDFKINIKEVKVESRNLTFNFLKPGPFYVLHMQVEIISKNEIISTISKKKITNMAEVNFPTESIKWMNSAEKNQEKYQLATFKHGLRALYQDVFFEAFGISLQI